MVSPPGRRRRFAQLRLTEVYNVRVSGAGSTDPAPYTGASGEARQLIVSGNPHVTSPARCIQRETLAQDYQPVYACRLSGQSRRRRRSATRPSRVHGNSLSTPADDAGERAAKAISHPATSAPHLPESRKVARRGKGRLPRSPGNFRRSHPRVASHALIRISHCLTRYRTGGARRGEKYYRSARPQP